LEFFSASFRLKASAEQILSFLIFFNILWILASPCRKKVLHCYWCIFLSFNLLFKPPSELILILPACLPRSPTYIWPHLLTFHYQSTS
jgi:hypothetical protein